MPDIVVEHLVKTFRVAERASGTWGAVKGLFRRRHRVVRALDDVSFAIESGELLGYIGPNGAGKSTTIKILSGILVPDSGQVNVLGRCPWKKRMENVRQLGVVFGQRTQLWWDLPAIESFELLRDIYSVPAGDYARTLDEMITLLELRDLLDQPVRQMSLGQRMRCDLAAALLHSPKLLFLDEPTIGLDAVAKLAVRDFIRKLNETRGVTVILTTHDMDDIEALCSRVLMIHEGKVLVDGSVEKLRAMVPAERDLTIDLANENEDVHDEQATIVERKAGRVKLRFDPAVVSAAALIGRITAKHAVRDLTVENPPIEQIIARLYGDARAGETRNGGGGKE